MHKVGELFAGKNIKNDVALLFEDVELDRMAVNEKAGILKLYIKDTRLIVKQEIRELERELSRKLQIKGVSKIQVVEKYNLPGVYTPKKWFENYSDSISLELMENDKFLYTMYHESEFSFKDDKTLVISLPDNIVFRNRQDDLRHVIDKIAFDRFGYALEFDFEYIKPKKSRYKEESEARVKQRIEKSIREYEDAGKSVTETESKAESAENINDTNASENKDKAENKPQDSGTSYNKGIKGRKNLRHEKGEKQYKMVRSDNPDVLFGRDFDGNSIELAEIRDEIGEAIVRGRIISIDTRFFEKTGKYMMKLELSDFTDSIKVKFFFNEEFYKEFSAKINEGDFISVKGIVTEDKFDREIEVNSPVGVKKISDFRTPREDNSAYKRVELHCHTKMSDMDGVSAVEDIIKQAEHFGHKALAVTDHGNVQAFPLANHAKLKNKDFKILYGVEGYLVNDLQKTVTNDKGQKLDGTFVVFDIETTGFSPCTDEIIEIGAVKVENLKVTERYSTFVHPVNKVISPRIQALTSIDNAMVKDAPTIDKVLPEFLSFCGDAVLVAHNADFDVSFIKANAERLGIPTDITYVDTMGISRYLFPEMAKHNLDAVCKKLKLVNEHHHRAVDDAAVTAKIFEKMITMLYEHEIYDLKDLKEKGVMPKESVAKLHYYHVIILAKNEIGRRNLYKLVSMSNVEYFHTKPKIPKSMIAKYREGLIIGSACERGEIYSALVRGEDSAVVAGLVDFYDYLEIQPIDNNRFQIASEHYPDINDEEDLRSMNKKIVALGDTYGKPVCATCDVHFLNPEDAIYREIILSSKKMNDEGEPTPLYLRTTEEMLDEFSYLGFDKAFEVVVKNTNMIADMCERITPVRPDKAPPVIENSDATLRKICYDKAHEMYGDPLPKIVEDRLERELTSIISNGYAVMYIIAQKLVWKSVEDGYLVGSRGSVGSSFVATMAGITEVNPLSPHYYCPECFYNDFYSDDVKQYAGMAGCDMPDKICPGCGKPLKKDGFDIPFETFLGFKGDKEPDIDLNFSGEYQSKAHKYTEVIFGAGQTFRAGTIAGLADKTAYGLVKHYFEEHNIVRRDGEITRIAKCCEGIRRTTGQHPGGIVVLPVGEDINSFTPLQKPANDMTTDIVTTHFEYHSIDHNLLKLDILGHDDPTMIKMLSDLTGIDPVKIPLDDPKVMSLFQNLEALNITPDMIGGTQLGSLGIPEFGTDFAMGMLLETKPTHFSDLVRIAGLSHGTNVWLGNAETLIKEGKATISTAICTRDDIMTYLIQMGLEPSDAFSIMENVRKGKVAKGKCDKWEKWKEDMLAHNVPDWYVWSCERIEYMFPKAHAAAYVMMAWRIAYCKINYPLAYYCAFFSIRAKAFSYETMCFGQAKVEQRLAELRKKAETEKLTASEDASIRDHRIVQEMYARGLEFMPIDIYKAKAKDFQIIDGKIMPAFVAIDGLGESVALQIEEAAKKGGKFLSKDDLKQRAKIGQSVIDKMSDLGILEGWPETNQLSVFDFM